MTFSPDMNILNIHIYLIFIKNLFYLKLFKYLHIQNQKVKNDL